MDVGSVNRVTLIGHAAGEIKSDRTEKNVFFCKFSLATNEFFIDRQGNKKEWVEWHRIIVFGKVAEFCSKWLKKGRLIFVEGKLRTRPYTDPDGVKRRITSINAEKIVFLGKREDFEPQEEREDSYEEKEREPGEDDPF